MEAELYSREDLPYLVVERLMQLLKFSGSSEAVIDYENPTDPDGWCVFREEDIGTRQFASPDDLSENSLLTCKGLVTAILAHAWAHRAAATVTGALNASGVPNLESWQVSRALELLVLGQTHLDRRDLPRRTTLSSVAPVNVSQDFVQGNWAVQGGVAATYQPGSFVEQSLFFDTATGEVAYLGSPQRIEGLTGRFTAFGLSVGEATGIAVSSPEWDAFDVATFAASPDMLPSDVVSLSKLSDFGWVAGWSDGFEVVLRDRYVDTGLVAHVLALVEDSGVPREYLPRELRFFSDLAGKDLDGRSNLNLVETAQAAGDFNTLLAAAEAAGLLETLTGEGPFTVFAPTDAAFNDLPGGTIEALTTPRTEGQLGMLSDILSYHVVSGKILSDDFQNGMEAGTILEGEAVQIGREAFTTVDNATITMTDIEASNGVIHVIDRVIMPGG